MNPYTLILVIVLWVTFMSSATSVYLNENEKGDKFRWTCVFIVFCLAMIVTVAAANTWKP